MKIDLGKGVGIKSGSDTAKQVNFSIGNASVIIEILRNNFYQNKVQTLVQEYICNARDGVRESLRTLVIKKNPKLNPAKEEKALEAIANFDENDQFVSWSNEEKAKELKEELDNKEKAIFAKIKELYADGRPTVEISIPTKFDSTFKVRDYGVGISPERMEKVFIQYGVSTKRLNNTQTGGFGIGAKSGWAYTSAFTIITYIDGIQRTYLAHIGDNQNGALKFRGECPTDQPNGTEIWVPLNQDNIHHDIISFRDATFRATQFWETRPLIKGLTVEEYPKSYKETDVIAQGSNWLIQGEKTYPFFNNYGSPSSRLVAVIDNIPYPVGNQFMRLNNVDKLLRLVSSSKMILLTLNNGDVEVVANREQLGDSQKSLQSINTICGEVYESILADIKKTINNSTSVMNFIENHIQVNSFLDKNISNSFNFEGIDYTLDSTNTLSSPLTAKVGLSNYRLETQSRGNKTILKEYKNSILSFWRSNEDLSKVSFMYNDCPATDKDYHIREKARTLAVLENHRIFVIEQNTLTKEEFAVVIRHFNAIASSSIEVIKVEKERKKRVSTKGLLCFHKLVSGYGRSYLKTQSMTISEEDFLNSKKTFLYMPMVEGKVQPSKSVPDRSNFSSICTYLHRDTEYVVVGLNDKVWDKVKKQKNIITFEKFIETLEDRIVFSASNKAHYVNSRLNQAPFYNILNRINAPQSTINDKELIETYNYFVTKKSIAISSFPCLYIQNKILPKIMKELDQEVTKYNAKVAYFEQKYPLASSIYLNSLNPSMLKIMLSDLVLYFNTKHDEVVKSTSTENKAKKVK